MSENYNKVSDIASEHLGKKAGDYSDFVNITEVRPDLLVAIPRELNRTDYSIDNDTFYGVDAWHGFEVSALTENGVPVSGVVKFILASDTPNIIESKSVKLYWNTFNNAKVGKTKAEVLANVKTIAERDLSAAAGGEVRVVFLTSTNDVRSEVLNGYALLDDLITDDLVIDSTARCNPSVLEANKSVKDLAVYTANLRSNCRVTNQPDFGDVFVKMKGDSVPTPNALMAYIVSFRNENHFHEECVEMMFKHLQDKFNPTELSVVALYTRRGGWNICPARASDPTLLPTALNELTTFHVESGDGYRQ